MSGHQPAERRPITSRETGWARRVASYLVRRGASANAISVSSLVFGLAAGGLALATDHLDGGVERLTWLAAAVCVQLRLLANLFDGMVAIESGQASPIGELFNEVPDRVSDAAILGSLGFVAGSSPLLGAAAALLAVFVAYVRAVGGSAGVGQVFQGIMAKQQRMFLVTVLCLFQATSPAAWRDGRVASLGAPAVVLLVICLGCGVTALTRLREIARRLRSS